ncbi:MAG: flagellum-specific ATP synthase FliI, partial [Pseudomonadota bacterium]
MRQALRLQRLREQLAEVRIARPVGRISAADGAVMTVTGLNDCAKIGDRVSVSRHSSKPLDGEIIQLADGHATVLPDAQLEGIAIGDKVLLMDPAQIRPTLNWIGRIVDPDGVPLDG